MLLPVGADPVTGARQYGRGQVERAFLISSLRQVGIPLTEIKSALDDEGTLGADRIAAFWAEAEAEHAARRRLVGSLIERLRGNESAMSMAYAVSTRSLPDRSVLTQTRHLRVDEQTVVREEFIGTIRAAGIKPLPGAVGAPFIIYYGDLSADSDGPIEWCWPVADERAEDLAGRFPDLTLRTTRRIRRLTSTTAPPPCCTPPASCWPRRACSPGPVTRTGRPSARSASSTSRPTARAPCPTATSRCR